MNYKDMPHSPEVEKLVDVISRRTQATNKHFFRILTSYFLCKVAGIMRAKIKAPDIREMPINFYGVNLAPSGFGLIKPTL